MKLSWSDIQNKFPNEHIVVVNPECPENYPANLQAGEVLDHDPNLDALLDRLEVSAYDSFAVKYTGDLGRAIGERGMVRIIDND